MYPDCLCLNEFNYYGNASIWQDCTTWDNNSNMNYPTESEQNHLMPIVDTDSTHLMSLCNSSSSSLVSSPKSCFQQPTMCQYASPTTMSMRNSSSAHSSPTSMCNTSSNHSFPMCNTSSNQSSSTSMCNTFSNQSSPTTSLPMFQPQFMPNLYQPVPFMFDSNACFMPLYAPYMLEKPMKCTKTKIYDCTLCPRSFARKHDLQRHIRVHTGAKPYYCLHCEKSFARTDALKRHLRMEESCRMSPVIQALKNVGMRRYRNL
ncbi:unnamed protein product [Rhizopus stolonifer]